MDYKKYMDSLYKLRDMPGIDYLCVAHSHEIDKAHLIMEAKEKIDNMIETRLKKDRRTLNVLQVKMYSMIYNLEI